MIQQQLSSRQSPMFPGHNPMSPLQCLMQADSKFVNLTQIYKVEPVLMINPTPFIESNSTVHQSPQSNWKEKEDLQVLHEAHHSVHNLAHHFTLQLEHHQAQQWAHNLSHYLAQSLAHNLGIIWHTIWLKIWHTIWHTIYQTVWHTIWKTIQHIRIKQSHTIKI